MLIDSALVPFQPRTRPRHTVAWLWTLRRNYIEAFPRSTYEQLVTRYTTRLVDSLLVTDPALIQEMLVERPEVFSRDRVTRRSFAPLVGDTSLFLAEGADWRWQRRAVSPTFRHDALLSFVPAFAAMADRQVERWRATVGGRTVDAAAAMTRTTFDVIVETMLGGSTTLDADRYARALSANFDTIPWHLLLALLSAPDWMPFPHRRRAMKARDYLHRDIGRIVAARRGTPVKPDLLHLLLAARDPETGRGMTDLELAANLLTFIAAGHETTAVALTWALWLVAKDADAQERIRQEVHAAAGTETIGAASIEGLAFTRQVIQEAMRLFPPAPALSRQARMETHLGGMRVTPRTRITIPVYALHRNARLWHQPDAFDPERFAPDQVKARSRHAYLPFGAGPRVCIGASFAMLEASVVLATLVRDLRFGALPGHRPKPVARLSLRPRGGMPLLVAPR